MVSNLEAEIQWTFAIALATATTVAVTYGGGITQKEYQWFFGLRRWIFPHVAVISIVLAAVFTVSAVGIFLWFRMREDFRSDYYDSVLGLHVGVLGMLFFFGKLFFSWHYFLVSFCFSVIAFAAATVALILLGIEGNRANEWAPFGLYFVLPVFLLYLCGQCCYIWLKNRSPPMRGGMKKMKHVSVESSSSAYSDDDYHSSSSSRRAAVILSDQPRRDTDIDF